MHPSLLHPLGLLALGAGLVTVVVWLAHPPPLGHSRARLALGVRLLIIVLCTLALAGLELDRVPGAQTLMVVADRSASPEGAVTSERDATLALRDRLGHDDRLGVVAFGRDAVIEQPPASNPVFSDFTTSPNPNYTNIEQGLRLAQSLMPSDTRQHVVLISDGRQNVGDAVAQARLLYSEGARVDVLPLVVRAGPDVRIDALDAPASIADGARAHVRVIIVSNTATTGTLRVAEDGVAVDTRLLDIPAGETDVEVTLPPGQPGFHRVRATVDPLADTLPQNNSGEALIEVLGTQRVLVVEGRAGAGANLSAALAAAGVTTTVVGPTGVPVDPAVLAGYQGIALVDVRADDLGTDRMTAIQSAVRDLGVGLSVFGGTETLGPGGFSGTPLEAALPIQMDISNQDQKPPIAVVLVLESVESSQGDAVVRGAAGSVVEHLTSRDYLGVIDAASGTAIPLTRLTDKAALERLIRNQSFGDAPSYEGALRSAGDALAAHPEATKHIIILGDGDAQATSPDLIASLVSRGITVSAVGVDVHRDPVSMAAMRAMATAGNGRYYQSEDASQVPDVLLSETDNQLKPWIVEGSFRPTVVSPSAALVGLDLSAFPTLTGYVASTPKASAEVVLRSPQRDPVLAQWQYGLGRASAWTSDTQGRWSAALLGWADGGRLLANIVGSTLPLAADPAISVRATVEGDRGHVIAEVAGAPADASVTTSILAPDRSATETGLVSTGPGRFEGDFDAQQVGSYLLRVGVSSGGRLTHVTTAGLAVAYSPEYRFLGTDGPVLREIAAAGGGVVLGSVAEAVGLPLPEVRIPVPLFTGLLVVATLLLPLDIGLRRLVVRRGDRAEWAAIVAREPGQPVPAEPTLAALRTRIDRHRTARHGPDRVKPEDPAAAAAAPPDGGAAGGTGADDLAGRLLERRRRAGRGRPEGD